MASIRPFLLAAAAAALALPARAEPEPGWDSFKALYKELVEINTTLSAGSCTAAAEAMAAHLKAAGFPDSDLHLIVPPERPKDGNLVAAFPASVGSAEKPTPKGAFVVRSVARNPEWRYNPRFAFKEIKTNRAFRVAAGPNNPLGTVWIGINKPSYGIHGTPDPEEVGTSASHGCVRLTNWDVQTLAKMVKRGTKVEFIE